MRAFVIAFICRIIVANVLDIGAPPGKSPGKLSGIAMADESFKEFVVDQLGALAGFRAKAMFGGVGLYQGDRFFGIVMEGRLYFKTDEQSRPAYLSRGMSPFVYEKARRTMTINYFEVPPDVLEDREELVAWAERAVHAAATRPRKPKRTRSIAALAFLLGSAIALAAAEAAFKRVEVDANPPQNPWIKIAGDLDGDGVDDLIIGGQGGPLVWYTRPNWSKHIIADGGYDSVDGEAADVNGDGRRDVIVGGVVWFENPGPGQAARDRWRAHRIGAHRTHDLEAADLDGDGKIDVVARGQTGFGHNEGHRIVLFHQISPTNWARSEIDCPPGEGLKVADLDRDSDPDIVIGSRWYANPGRSREARWAEHLYAARWDHADGKVEIGDFNGDQRLDIVLTPAEPRAGRYRVAWYAAPEDPRQPDWTEHVVVPEIETVVHALAAADLDQDGSTDVVLARMHQGSAPQEVAVYFNSGQGRRWTKHVLSEKGSHNIVLVDADGDGRLDILGANHGGAYQPVELWKIDSGTAGGSVKLIESFPGAGGLACYRVETPAATYLLEKTGAGLSGLIDIEGRDWISFNPAPGSGAGGEYRGFPNAVHREAGNYFHPKNSATDPSITRVERAEPARVTISAVSSNGLWAGRYDFFPGHCTFTMTKMPPDRKYWVLYEGTPGGQLDETDWWITSALHERRPIDAKHTGDIPAPEWIAFGDAKLDRVLFLFHHDDDSHPDTFYPMNGKMTVFGFGRRGLAKFLDSVPQRFSIGFIETSDPNQIARSLESLLD